jgi:hypothetical protein
VHLWDMLKIVNNKWLKVKIQHGYFTQIKN